MIRLGVTAARCLMKWLLIHLVVAATLERVRLKAISAVNLHYWRRRNGTNSTGSRKKRESCETNAPITTLPAVWAIIMMISTCFFLDVRIRPSAVDTLLQWQTLKGDRSSKLLAKKIT